MGTTKDVRLRLLIETVDKASRGVKTVTKSVDGLSQALGKAEKISGRLAIIGASLTAAFVFPVKAASDFEKSMSAVRAVTEGAMEAFSELNKVASELGGRTEFTAKQVADGMRFLGQAGFDATQVMKAMPDVIDLATAGQLDLAAAADIASNVLQGMQLEISQLNRVMDVLAVTATSSNTNVRQLGEALKFAAPASAIAGISIEKTAGIIGILGNNGIQASLAGTALRGMLASLANPSKQAQEALDRLGVTVTRGRDGSLDLIETLRDLGDANIKIGDTFEIFRRRGASAALALANQIDKVDELVVKNEEGSGALKKMANIMRDNLSVSITILISAFNRLLRSIGAPLLSSLKFATLALAKFVDNIAAGASKISFITTPLLVLTGSLGLFLVGMSSVIVSLKILIPLFTHMKVALLAHPYTAVAIALASLTVSLIGYFKAGETALEVTEELNREAQELATSFSATIGRVEDADIALKDYGEGTEKSAEAQEKLIKNTSDLSIILEKHIEELEKAKDSGDRLSESEIEIKESAFALKLQINSLKGGFFDAGEAAKRFSLALRVDALEKYRDKIKETAKEFSKLGTVFDASKPRYNLPNIEFELKELPPELIAKLRAQALIIIKELEQIGDVDFSKPSNSLKDVTREFISGRAAIQAFQESFFNLSKTFEEVKEEEATIKSLSESFEEQRIAVDLTTIAVKELQKVVDSMDTFKNRLKLQDAQKEETAAIKKTRIALQELSDFRVEIAKKAGEKAIAVQKELFDRGISDKKKQSLAILVIEVDTQRAILKIKGDIATEAVLTFEAGSDAFKAFTNQASQAITEFEEANKTSNFAIEKSQREHKEKLSRTEKRAAIRTEAILTRLKNSHISNLSAIESAFRSTYRNIGGFIESIIRKQESKIGSLNRSAKSSIRDLADIEKGNRQALLELSDSQLSNDRRRIVQAERLEAEYRKLRSASTFVGPDPESIKNAERLIQAMIEVRDNMVEAGKESKGITFEWNEIGVKRLNSVILELGQNMQKSWVEQIQNAQEELLHIEEVLKRLQELRKLKITLENMESVNKQLDKIVSDFKNIGIDIPPDKLIALRERIESIFKKDIKANIKIDEINATKNAIKIRAIYERIIGRPITITVIEKRVQAKRLGGLIRKFAAGGGIPGFGGGDRIQALLERGEYVIRKEAVSRYGSAFMNAINQMKFGSGPQRFKDGGSVANAPATNLNLSFNKSEKVSVSASEDQVRKLVHILRREGLVTL